MNKKVFFSGIIFGSLSLSAVAGDTEAVMGMVNRAMRDANRAVNPSTSMEELQQIQRHYNGWTNQYSGTVTQMEMQNRLAQRYYWEQARRQREIEISNAIEAERRARAVHAYGEWLR